MSTNYMVVARIEGARVRVKLHPTFEAAQAHWKELDEALRDHRLVILSGGIQPSIDNARRRGPGSSDYIAVRDADDPQWNRQRSIKLGVVRKGAGSSRVQPVIERIGKEQGIHGHEGGWLYRGGLDGHKRDQQGCRRLSYQGWMSWWYHRGEPGQIVRIENRYHRLSKESQS